MPSLPPLQRGAMVDYYDPERSQPQIPRPAIVTWLQPPNPTDKDAPYTADLTVFSHAEHDCETAALPAVTVARRIPCHPMPVAPGTPSAPRCCPLGAVYEAPRPKADKK